MEGVFYGFGVTEAKNPTDYDYYAFDLSVFAEPVINKPLIQGVIVSHNGKKYRVDRWFSMFKEVQSHCYVFINISNDNIKPFGKKPSEVKELVDSGKLKIEKYI